MTLAAQPYGDRTVHYPRSLVELVGQAGNYDYVEFTAEYAPFDLHELDNLGRALELMGLAGMIKVEQTMWTHQAMRAIGSGFQSVLFADVRTVADARACVAAAVAGILLFPIAAGPRHILSQVPVEKSPAALEDRARELLGRLVEAKPVDHESGLSYDWDYYQWAREPPHSSGRWKQIGTGDPPLVE